MGAPTPPNAPGPQRARGRYGRIVARTIEVTAIRRHFPGQLPNEQVIWLKRRHPIFLFVPAWPVALSLVGLFFVHTTLGAVGGLAALLQIAVGLLVAVLTIRWIILDLGNWLFQYYILTDLRVIASRGFFQPVREEVVLKNVVQVVVQRQNPFVIALGVGTVIVRPLGTPITLADVAYPRTVADSILAAQEAPPGRPGAATPATPPHLQSKKLQATLDALAEPVPSPAQPRRSPSHFGGILQRKVPIKFIEGEEVMEVVYRHWFILLLREIPAVLLFAAGIVGNLLIQRFGGPAQSMAATIVGFVGVFAGVGWALLIYLNYADDIFVLTTHRVIDIDRFIFVLTEYSNDAPYARVQDIHVELSLIGNILGYGSIVVETSGRKYPVQMSDVPHPLALMDRVFGYMNAYKERESAAAINKQKKENYRWMASVLDDLLIQAPNVQGLPLLEATARAHAAGLKLVVDVERPAPGVAPGTVLSQVPAPGATEVLDGELRVVLSGQSAPVTP